MYVLDESWKESDCCNQAETLGFNNNIESLETWLKTPKTACHHNLPSLIWKHTPHELCRTKTWVGYKNSKRRRWRRWRRLSQERRGYTAKGSLVAGESIRVSVEWWYRRLGNAEPNRSGEPSSDWVDPVVFLAQRGAGAEEQSRVDIDEEGSGRDDDDGSGARSSGDEIDWDSDRGEVYSSEELTDRRYYGKESWRKTTATWWKTTALSKRENRRKNQRRSRCARSAPASRSQAEDGA